MTFPEKMRRLRDDVGLSEMKLAKASGISYGSIHAYGLGTRKPSLEAAVKIAHALGESVEVFADTVPDKPAPKKRPKK